MTGIGESSYRRDPADGQLSLEMLAHTYSDALVRYAYCYVGSAEVAEEVMEDGLSIISSADELKLVFDGMDYEITEANGIYPAKKNGIIFTFSPGEYLNIAAQVTNREGIIY